MKRQVIDLDPTYLPKKTHSDPSLQHVYASTESSWPKVWDAALDKGPFGTSSTLAMSKLFSLRTTLNNLYPVSDASLSNHFIATHTDLAISADDCVH